MEFFDWTMLGTFAGAVFAVSLFTQFSKDIPLIKKIPTQLWSYIVSVIVLAASKWFTTGMDLSSIGLIMINSVLVSLASNGGYEAINKIKNASNEKIEG